MRACQWVGTGVVITSSGGSHVTMCVRAGRRALESSIPVVVVVIVVAPQHMCWGG